MYYDVYEDLGKKEAIRVEPTCENCANRYNTLKCPVAKYYETKDNDICSWHERKR